MNRYFANYPDTEPLILRSYYELYNTSHYKACNKSDIEVFVASTSIYSYQNNHIVTEIINLHINNFFNFSCKYAALYSIYQDLFDQNHFDVIEHIVENSNKIGCIDNITICLLAIETANYQILNLLKYRSFPFDQDIVLFKVDSDNYKYEYVFVGENAFGYAISRNNMTICEFLIEEIGITPFNRNIDFFSSWHPSYAAQFDSQIAAVCSQKNNFIDYFWKFDIPQKNLEAFFLSFCVKEKTFGDNAKSIIQKMITSDLDINLIDQEYFESCSVDIIRYLLSLGLIPKANYISTVCKRRNIKHLDILLEHGIVIDVNELMCPNYNGGTIFDAIEILIKYQIDLSTLSLSPSLSPSPSMPSGGKKYSVLCQAEELGLDKYAFMQYYIDYISVD